VLESPPCKIVFNYTVKSFNLSQLFFWLLGQLGGLRVTTPLLATPLLEECEDDIHTPEMGTWESSKTPETLKFNCKGQNTLPWGVLYIIRKLSKCRCRKWPRMSQLDISRTSYGKKKGRESNRQFDSRPLKVGNWPDPGACRGSATDR